MNSLFKLTIVNLFLVAGVLVGYFYGYVGHLFTDDTSFISYLIGGLICLNIVFAFIDCFEHNREGSFVFNTPYMEWLKFIYGKMMYIGLVGTVIGFRHLTLGLHVATDPNEIIKSIEEGCTTLANTTLLGLVGYLWASLNFYIVGE